MNYNDYNARQSGGALPYFAGARYHRCHGRLVRTEHKKAAKRRVTDAGKNLLSGLLNPGVRPRKRIKLASAKNGVTTVAIQRKIQTLKKREADTFDDGVRA